MTLTRDAAYELLRSWTDSEALMTHARAVEVVMRAAAHRYGAGDADEERFGLAGLLGNPQTLGHAFHITSDESITWRQAYEMAAAAFNVPYIPVEISSHTLAKAYPDWEGTLLGDKAISVVFDNSKIKRFVPDYVATRRYRDGIKRSIAWYDADPARRSVDEATNATHDKLIAAYKKGLLNAQKVFLSD